MLAWVACPSPGDLPDPGTEPTSLMPPALADGFFTPSATWNQGKSEAVKQEMARVNVDILGISELRWTGMGEVNSDDHDIYYCGQESLRRNGVAIIVNKSLKSSTWMQYQKRQNDLFVSKANHSISQ